MLTYEMLRDDPAVRKQFNQFDLDQKRQIFKRLGNVGDLNDDETKAVQNKLMMTTSEADQQVPLQPGTQTVNDMPMSWSQVGTEAIKNLDDSAIEYGKSMWQALRHPIQTGQQLYGLMAGAVEKAIPGGEDKHEKVLMDTVNFFKERYGGENFAQVMESVKKTMAGDPIGFLSDLSIVMTGGSTAIAKGAQIAGRAAKIAKVAGVVEKVAKTAGKAKFLDPTVTISTGVGKVGKVGVKAILGGEGVKATRKFNDKIKKHLKFSGKLPESDAITKEFLDRGMQLDRKTSQKLGVSMKMIGREVESAIDRATKAGNVIETAKIMKAFDDVIDNFAKSGLTGVNEPAFMKQLMKLKKDWSEIKGTTMTPRALQDMKVGLGKKFSATLGDEYGALKNKLDDSLRDTAMQQLNDLFPAGEVITDVTSLKGRLTGKGTKGLKDIKGSVKREGLRKVNVEFGKQKDLKELIERRVEQLAEEGGFMKGGLEQAALAKSAMALFAASGIGVATGGQLGGAIGFMGALLFLGMYGKPTNQIRIARALAKARGIRISVAKNLVAQKVNEARKVVERASVQLQRTKGRE